jgi:hypothetical protein
MQADSPGSIRRRDQSAGFLSHNRQQSFWSEDRMLDKKNQEKVMENGD